jgi:hypothetical protein
MFKGKSLSRLNSFFCEPVFTVQLKCEGTR